MYGVSTFRGGSVRVGSPVWTKVPSVGIEGPAWAQIPRYASPPFFDDQTDRMQHIVLLENAYVGELEDGSGQARFRGRVVLAPVSPPAWFPAIAAGAVVQPLDATGRYIPRPRGRFDPTPDNLPAFVPLPPLPALGSDGRVILRPRLAPRHETDNLPTFFTGPVPAVATEFRPLWPQRRPQGSQVGLGVGGAAPFVFTRTATPRAPQRLVVGVVVLPGAALAPDAIGLLYQQVRPGQRQRHRRPSDPWSWAFLPIVITFDCMHVEIAEAWPRVAGLLLDSPAVAGTDTWPRASAVALDSPTAATPTEAWPRVVDLDGC